MDMDNYDMRFELQRSYFLRDLLSDVFEFEYENHGITIYRIKGVVKEQCCVGDVIYYLHVDSPIHDLVPRLSEELSRASSRPKEEHDKAKARYERGKVMASTVAHYLGTIEQVKRLIENMVIIYECEPDESDEEVKPNPRAVKQMDHLPKYTMIAHTEK